MSPRLRLAAPILLLALTYWQPLAAAPDERQRLAVERQALEQRFDTEERACAGRFAVNACIDDVRARRRAALAPLREAGLRLAEAERQRRAELRRAEVARKQQALAERKPPDEADAAPPSLRLREPAAPLPPASAPTGGKAPAPGQQPRERAQEAAAAASRAAALRQAGEKAQAAEARIQARRARQAERLARQGRRADTLPRLPPPPAAASQPAR